MLYFDELKIFCNTTRKSNAGAQRPRGAAEKARHEEKPTYNVGRPYVQEDMNHTRAARQARQQPREPENGENHTPHVPDEHQETSEQQFGTSEGVKGTSSSRGKSVSEAVCRAIKRASHEFGDEQHVPSNISQVNTIFRQADVQKDQLLAKVSEAQAATRAAAAEGAISKRDAHGNVVKMPYFFAVLRQQLGLVSKP